MIVIDKPRNVTPPKAPRPKKRGRPNLYKITFNPGVSGACAGSHKILCSVFNFGRGSALDTLIDSTMSRKEVIYQGTMDVVKTKLREAGMAKRKHKKEFPRLKRISFTFDPL